MTLPDDGFDSWGLPPHLVTSLQTTHSHPLGSAIHAAWMRFPPPADDGWTRMPSWAPGVFGVVAFTGHAIVCAPDDLSDKELATLGADGTGGAHHPAIAMALLGGHGVVHSLDLLMVASGTGRDLEETDGLLVRRPDLDDHPRVRYAAAFRTDARAFGLTEGDDVVVSLSTGIGGLQEIGVEVAPGARGQGLGAEVLRAASALIPEGHPLIASAAPGNVIAVQALLGSDYELVGSHQVVVRDLQ